MIGKPLCLVAHTDGGSRGNPGPGAAAYVLRDAEDGTVLAQEGIYLGKTTNNVAEYRGLVGALESAVKLGAQEVTVLSDSELLVHQMNGQYRVRNAGLVPLYEQAKRLAGRLERCVFQHVRREANDEADRLANRAMDLRRNVQEP